MELGKVIYTSTKNMNCQIFPEGVKKSKFYICVLTDRVLYFPENTSGINDLFGVEDCAGDTERIIFFDDIERVVYPSEDVKIFLWIKRKGNRTIRIYRKSTGKYCDVCVGTPKDTKVVYDLLMKQLGNR